MKSLTSKLILAILIIGVITVGVVILISQRGADREFNAYLLNLDRTAIAEHFIGFYRENRSWDGVENTVEDLYTQLKIPTDPKIAPPLPFTLSDQNRKVVLPSGFYKTGDYLLQMDYSRSIPITVDSVVAGYLDIRSPVPRPEEDTPRFLDRVRFIMMGSGVIGLGITLIIGIFFSRWITKSLRELTAAAKQVAKGDLTQQVKVRSSDELGELARVFNEMTAQLRQLMQSRKQMTADIAHELRTPISIILGHAEGIHDGVLPANRDTVEIIRDEAIRLDHLVNDLRTLALSDAGELKLDLRDVSVHSLLNEVFILFDYQAKSLGINLHLDSEETLPQIKIDANRMIQVLSNLVENALHGTPAGGSIFIIGKETGSEIEIIVKDTGRGIAHEDLDKIFDRLYRADKSRQRENGGSGLGLAIAKSIIEQHGGQIYAESETGEGTAITIRLPKSN